MASLHEKIAEKFLAELSKSSDLKPDQIQQLKALLSKKDKKLKADDFVNVFNPMPQSDV